MSGIIYADFETYWGQDYTLTKMDQTQYVMDQRLQVHGCAIAIDAGPVVWVPNDASGSPEGFAAHLDRVVNPDLWDTHALCAWNCRFDASVMWWRVGRKPRAYFDPMAMSRGLIGHLTDSVRLDRVAQLCGLPGKIQGVLANSKDMSTEQIIRAGLMADLGRYGIHDVDLCRRIFLRQIKVFPRDELDLVDALVRLYVEPALHLDHELLADRMTAIKDERAAILSRLGVTAEDIRSDTRFAALLRRQNIVPPTKPSPSVPGKTVFAFSKTDTDFVALGQSDTSTPAVKALVEARLGIKSSIEESRTQRLLDISKIRWPRHVSETPTLPVPLAYYAAHTGRLGGDYRINLQNLGRNSPLRKALRAPPGYVVLAADAAQIEARVTAWLAKQDDLVAAFARGEDVYSLFASEVYGRPIDKKNNPLERFLGKTCILGLGFGMSAPKFKHTVLLQSGFKMDLPDVEAQRVVSLYRRKYNMIPLLWQRCSLALDALATQDYGFKLGPVSLAKNALVLPNGMRLHYRDLTNDGSGWSYLGSDGKRVKLWHGQVCENVVQALARICVTDARWRVKRIIRNMDLDARFVLTVHDELVYVVRDGAQRIVLAEILEREMSRPPSWGVGLPLAAESGYGPTYGDAK